MWTRDSLKDALLAELGVHTTPNASRSDGRTPQEWRWFAACVHEAGHGVAAALLQGFTIEWIRVNDWPADISEYHPQGWAHTHAPSEQQYADAKAVARLSGYVAQVCYCATTSDLDVAEFAASHDFDVVIAALDYEFDTPGNICRAAKLITDNLDCVLAVANALDKTRADVDRENAPGWTTAELDGESLRRIVNETVTARGVRGGQ